MSKRELGNPTKEDKKEIETLARNIFATHVVMANPKDVKVAKDVKLKFFTTKELEEMLHKVWALGHNQGYDDAYTEQEA
jgi:hypothetical protein